MSLRDRVMHHVVEPARREMLVLRGFESVPVRAGMP